MRLTLIMGAIRAGSDEGLIAVIRGILSGGFWGFLTVVAGLSIASLLATQPAGNRPPESPQVEGPSDGMSDEVADETTLPVAPDVAPVAEDAGSAEAGQGTVAALPQIEEPPESPSALIVADTSPTDPPQTSGVTTEPVAPVTGPDEASAAGLLSASDGPVELATPAPAPQVPAPEDDLSLSTATATPAPLPAEPIEAPAPDPEQPVIEPETSEAEPAIELAIAAPSGETAVPDANVSALATPPAEELTPSADPALALTEAEAEIPSADTATSGPEAPALGGDLPQVVATPETAGDVVAEAPAPLVLPEELSEPDVTPVTDPAPTPAPQEPEIAVTEGTDAPAEEEAPGLPAVVVRNSDGAAMPTPDVSVRINRPGDVAEEAPEDANASEDPVEGALTPEGPALVRFATELENPDGRPLLGIVLIDTLELGDATAVVDALPFDVTVAIDPSLPGAQDRAAAYRAAGIEVMALVVLPQGAQPTDVEVVFESAFLTLPEAIGVLDAGEGGLQANSAVTDQAMARLARDGRGVVTLSEGLNMASRAAEDAGVPSGTIYRDLDSEGQRAQVIRRFLDQAAFRARQTSGEILLGRIRPDTISALMLWGSEARARQVAVAPVSAVLLDQGTAP